MEKLGNILVRAGYVSSDRLEEALVKSMAIGRRLGRVLVEEGLVAEEDLATALARQLGMAMIDLDNTHISLDAIKLLPRRVAVSYNVLPVQIEGRLLTVAVADPTNVTVDDVVRAATGYDVRAVVSTPSAVRKCLEKYYPPLLEEEPAPPTRATPIFSRLAPAQQGPLGRQETAELTTVRDVIQTALAEAVRRTSLGVRDPSSASDLDLSAVLGDGALAVHVSIVPYLYGEKIEVSISDRQQHLKQLAGLGLSPQDARMMRSLLGSPEGMVLVVGPPGSGKTTTLYAALRHLNQLGRRITTVEEPIAYPLRGVYQLPADEASGISIAEMVNIARDLMFDIIMVGNLPDRRAAQAALEAAADGHLVLAAMEAPDTPSALTRLLEGMLLPPDLVASALIGVITQRLVRKIDPLCKETHRPDDRLLVKYLGTADASYVQSLYHGKGCRFCDGGYRGCTGLFQIIPITDEMRTLIQQRPSPAEITDAVIALSVSTLLDQGINRVLNGVTTLEELDRVLANHHFSAKLAHAVG